MKLDFNKVLLLNKRILVKDLSSEIIELTDGSELSVDGDNKIGKIIDYSDDVNFSIKVGAIIIYKNTQTESEYDLTISVNDDVYYYDIIKEDDIILNFTKNP